MSFVGQVYLTEWRLLKIEDEEVAEVWFIPDGSRVKVVFLVQENRLKLTDTDQRVTLDTLLRMAGISIEEVESWWLGDSAPASTGEDNSAGGDSAPASTSEVNPVLEDPLGDLTDEFLKPLPLPPARRSRLMIYVHLKAKEQQVVLVEGSDQKISLEKWQALESLWKTILGLESNIDASRMSMDALQSEMENAFRRQLSTEEKNHALQSDVAQLTKAKSRVHFELPKVREFMQRATWAMTLPERALLEEVWKNHIEPRKEFPGLEHLGERLEHLRKDRQVLLAHGVTVSQKCRATLGEIQSALSTLQRNATTRARQKKNPGREKGKFH